MLSMCNGTIRMIFEGEELKMLTSFERGAKLQSFQETKASISKSIIALHASTCVTSTCDRGIDSKANEMAKAHKERESRSNKTK